MSIHENGGKDRPMVHSKPDNLRPTPQTEPKIPGESEHGGGRMNAKPILFSGPMVRAILEGRKTQTRRVVKPQPDGWGKDTLLSVRENDGSVQHIPFGGFASHPDAFCLRFGDTLKAVYCPYGQPGDLLWVRETHARIPTNQVSGVHYMADGPTPSLDDRHDAGLLRVYPSIHMPRWASRLTLRITDVRLERLNTIEDSECRAEGIRHYVVAGPDPDGRSYQDWRTPFKELWDSINGKRGYSWASDPWVWVVAFEAIQRNVAEVLAGAAV